jgi:hypothetical protein
MVSKKLLTTVLALAVATPAMAQSIGMQVVDLAGAPVGTVTAIHGDNLQVKTGKHEALLPKASFRADGGKLLFAMTQAQLDSQIEATMASANAAIAAGATVKGAGGTQVGTIDSVADGKVVVALQSGQKVAIPANGVRGNADGTVTLGYSSAQLEALVKGSDAATATQGQ